MTKNGNDAAMPQISTFLDQSSERLVPMISSNGGLTKREMFAAMAMMIPVDENYISNEQDKDRRANPYNTMDKPAPRSRQQIIAQHRVAMADALIEALNQDGGRK